MSTTSLTLDGFPFVGATPGGGSSRVLQFEGWLARVVRRERQPLTGRPGSTSSAGLDDSRTITLKALVRYSTAAEAAAERRVLRALGGHSGVAVVVTDAAGATEGVVTVERISAEPITDRLLDVTALLTLDDPHVRSTTARTTVVGAGSSVAAVNDGTAPADLVVTLTSGGTVVLSAGGLTLTTGTLPAGAVIDTAATSVRASDGSSLFTSVSLPPMWPALPAGGGTIQQAGTAALSIEHFDPYA